jgi:hypothetical protein
MSLQISVAFGGAQWTYVAERVPIWHSQAIEL